MTREEIFEEIATLAVQLAGAKRDKLTPQTRLVGDLGLDGDPAVAFVQAFSERFAVDMADFYWLRYFGDEGWNMLTSAMVLAAQAVSPRFRQRWRAARDEEREITFDHLVDVAEAKTWIHPSAAHRPSAKPNTIGKAIGVGLTALATLGVAAFAVGGVVMVYGLAAGALGEVSPLSAATAALMTGLPVLLFWNAWRTIQRKLASAAAS